MQHRHSYGDGCECQPTAARSPVRGQSVVQQNKFWQISRTSRLANLLFERRVWCLDNRVVVLEELWIPSTIASIRECYLDPGHVAGAFSDVT